MGRGLPGKLEIGGNYLWCLFIVIFMDLEDQRGWEGEGNFYGGELTSLDTMGLTNYYYVFNTILNKKMQHNILHFFNTT